MTTDVAAAPPVVPAAALTIPAWQQLLRFAAVGIASMAAYALLYLALRSLVGPFAANALALLLTAVANTAANRRLTFGVKGSSGVVGDHAVGLLAFAAGLAQTTGALAGLHAISDSGRSTELVVLMLANALATLLRFVVLRLRLHSVTPS
jgi:putative flippase GtrA